MPTSASGNVSATCCRPIRSAKKKRHLLQRLGRLPPRGVVLAEDETDLRLFPPLRSGWAVRGQPAPVPISGGNAKRVLFGALNIRTGQRLFLPRKKQRGENFRAFLELVRWHWRSFDLWVLLDEDSSHTAGPSQALAEELSVELLWLPKRSPHLNPMDHLWRHGKEVKSANWQYATIDFQAERFISYLSGLSARETLRKAGLLAEDSWLKTIVSKNF
jgi:transposase